MIGQGSLALARHRFAEALGWGERARAVAPRRAAVYGVLVDAYVELGRYDQAVAAAQQMVDIRPDGDSYSRVAYLRELHGDLPGAIAAMGLAAEAGAPAAEATAWALVQLGHLHMAAGDEAAAEAAYAQALAGRPGDPHAEAGQARALAARGQLAEAAARYEAVVARLPLPEYAVALGDLYEAMGRPEDAARQRELVRAMQGLSAGAGVDVDLELALFEADHGLDPAAAVDQARTAYARRPSVLAADALAWALHRAGAHEEASRYSAEALRLGTRDPAMRLRAGLIAYAAGDNMAAREHLSLALMGGLTPLGARQAADALTWLGADAPRP
jgi:tetratricopeptide (TPR) repeat protein